MLALGSTDVLGLVAMAANAAGLISRLRGDPRQPKTNHLQALAVFQELGSEIGLAYTRCCLGYADHHLGQASTAAQHFGQALTLAHKAGRSDILATALEGPACAAAAQDVDICAQLLGAAQRIRETTGIHLTMIEGHDPQQAQAHARAVLGTKQFAVATDTGKHSSLDEMLPLGAGARASRTPRRPRSG
jgi:hypothetical protein